MNHLEQSVISCEYVRQAHRVNNNKQAGLR